MIKSGELGSKVGAIDTLGAGLGQSANEALAANASQAGSGIMQAAPGMAATAQQAATAPELAGNVSQGITSVAPPPQAGALNPLDAATAQSSMSNNTVVPAQYDIRSAAQNNPFFQGNKGMLESYMAPASETALKAPASALERGFDKAMTWAGKNPIPAAIMDSS